MYMFRLMGMLFQSYRCYFYLTDAMLQRNVTQAQKNFKLLQHERELNQFIADVDNMLTWLHEVKGNQSKLQSSQGKISSLDFIIKHHRVIYI